MSRAAKLGLFLLMGLVVALARLVEVEVAKRPVDVPMAIGASLGAPPHKPEVARPARHHERVHARAPAAQPTVAAPKPAPKPEPAKPATEEASGEWPHGAFYTVKKGETLGEIAQKVLGTSRLWQKLYDANAARIGNPNGLRPGTKLVVPRD
jgi:nucleoid-associated protein YgaU